MSVLTFVIMAYDRYRFIEDPSKQRLPAVVFAIGTWLTASCIVVPYPIYTTYLDLDIETPVSLVLFSLHPRATESTNFTPTTACLPGWKVETGCLHNSL